MKYSKQLQQLLHHFYPKIRCFKTLFIANVLRKRLLKLQITFEEKIEIEKSIEFLLSGVLGINSGNLICVSVS